VCALLADVLAGSVRGGEDPGGEGVIPQDGSPASTGVERLQTVVVSLSHELLERRQIVY
jgi:hypothetical protein